MRERLRSPAWLLEAFVASNLLFLVADISLAHSVNAFHHPAEWIPLVFSAVGGLTMAVVTATGRPEQEGDPRRGRDPRRGWRGRIGEVVGWCSVVVGVSGLLWHLSGEFFASVALESLVYSAPFVAPLAYTGLGLLLLLNRRIDASLNASWGRWMLFLALAGIFGNFGLSLADHARNGFFDPREWIAVAAAAVGVGCVLVAVLWPRSRPALRVAWAGLAVQALVGVLGLALHLMPLVTEASSASLWQRAVYGPPPFAPLLFVDLCAPAALGLWVLGADLAENRSRIAPTHPRALEIP